MTDKEFIDKIHKRISIVCIGASALRNQGAPGIVEVARNYFSNISLDEYFESLSNSDKFNVFLDSHTNKLVEKFPDNGKSWGAARKGLNLFFRELVYNKFITDYYNFPINIRDFNEIIKNLEVPLDLDVATGIYIDSNFVLSKWESIKKLNIEMSKLYQKEALKIAKSKNIARVHLDLFYWREKQ